MPVTTVCWPSWECTFIWSSSHRLLVINRGTDRSFTIIWTAIIRSNACRTTNLWPMSPHSANEISLTSTHNPSLMGNHWPLSCICRRREYSGGSWRGGGRSSRLGVRREDGQNTAHIFSHSLHNIHHRTPLLWILHAEEQRMHAGLAFAIFNAAQTTTKCPLRYGHGCNTHEYAMRWHRVRSIIPLVFRIQGCSSRRSTLL